MYEWISFDLYGSLIDVEMGMRQFFKRLLLKKGIPIPADTLVKSWRTIHGRMLLGGFRRYREILYDSLDVALREAKVSYDQEDGRAFAVALGSWRPYSDATATLPRLQKVSKIAVLANADREFVLRSVGYLGVAANLVLTSEDVHAYKPSGKIFVAALAKMYAPAANCLHVTADPDVDLEPARKLGFKVCLLRRTPTAREVKPAPEYNVPSLLALAARLQAPQSDKELPPWQSLDI